MTARGFQYAGMTLLPSLVLTLLISQGHLSKICLVTGPLLFAVGIDLILISFVKKGSFYSSHFYSSCRREINRSDNPQMFWGAIVSTFYISNMIALIPAFSNW